MKTGALRKLPTRPASSASGMSQGKFPETKGTTREYSRFWLTVVLLLWAMPCPAAPDSGQHQDVAQLNAWCLRCHGMSTMQYLDPTSGQSRNLHVDSAKFALSDHGRQACVTCHRNQLTDLPHPPATSVHHSCGDCHRGEKLIQRMRLVGITAQFNKSVHLQRNVPGFDCFSCHNPHESRLEDIARPEADVVQRDNGICSKCHGTLETNAGKHAVIPKASLHLKAVRCLDCHTPRPGSVIHAIEPAARAERTCEACHSRNSILLTKLYKYRLHESEQRAGFINGVVLSDYYVIGMTRHPFLDALGILGMGGALLGVLLHGAGRWLAMRRRTNHES
ncbi:MAG: hypothetical protein HQL73_05615 [Magnetococcales bacterium]|nr:hypothetical protein [Magnetococcales bacterium]